MPTATLIRPNVMSFRGVRYEKNKPVPVSRDLARTLHQKGRFKINWATPSPAGGVAVSLLADMLDEAPAVVDFTKLTEIEAIRAASDMLDVEDERLFDEDGRPALKALSLILGYEVTDEMLMRALPPLPATSPSQAAMMADERRAGRVRIKTRDPVAVEA